MKPLPHLDDDAAMVKRGRLSAIGAARNDALQELRDACTYCQSAEWGDLPQQADRAIAAAERLKTVAALWDEWAHESTPASF